MSSTDAAREVLVAELLGDLHVLYKAVEGLKPVLERVGDDLVAQSDALRRDSAQLRDRVEALVTHTQAGAVTHLVAKTNELTAQACIEFRRSMNDAACEAWRSAAAHRLELHATQLQAALAAAPPGRSRRPGVLVAATLGSCLVGFLAGVLTMAGVHHLH